MAKIHEGDRWGRLVCVRVQSGKKTILFDGGSEEVPYMAATLECECGKEVVVDRDEFKGKRAVRDCGCGLAGEDMGTTNRMVSMPVIMALQVREYAI